MKKTCHSYYANTLTLLYECQLQVENHTKAEDTLTKLLHLLPSLVNASIPEVYANLKVLSGIAFIFWLKINGMTDEATQLEKKTTNNCYKENECNRNTS